MKGTFVGLKAGKVTLSGVDSDWDIVSNPTVVLNGKNAKLENILPGDEVVLSNDNPATILTVTRRSLSGKFIKSTDKVITLSHDGEPDSVHAIALGAPVTLDGNVSKLADLKAGDEVVLASDPATSIAAKRVAVFAAVPKTKAEVKAEADKAAEAKADHEAEKKALHDKK